MNFVSIQFKISSLSDPIVGNQQIKEIYNFGSHIRHYDSKLSIQYYLISWYIPKLCFSPLTADSEKEKASGYFYLFMILLINIPSPLEATFIDLDCPRSSNPITSSLPV
jgi:hypothetical protein